MSDFDVLFQLKIKQHLFLVTFSKPLRQVPADQTLPLIVDHCATQQACALACHPCEFVLAKWGGKVLWLDCRETNQAWGFYFFEALEAVIQDVIDAHNADCKPFIWTTSVSEILQKVGRARQAI
ncbi:MAG: hypothetical protein ACK5HY_08130 [Parahaliea sp.]